MNKGIPLVFHEKVDLYLDDRKAKGMNVVQLFLFWGRRYVNATHTGQPFYLYPLWKISFSTGNSLAKDMAMIEILSG